MKYKVKRIKNRLPIIGDNCIYNGKLGIILSVYRYTADVLIYGTEKNVCKDEIIIVDLVEVKSKAKRKEVNHDNRLRLIYTNNPLIVGCVVEYEQTLSVISSIIGDKAIIRNLNVPEFTKNVSLYKLKRVAVNMIDEC